MFSIPNLPQFSDIAQKSDEEIFNFQIFRQIEIPYKQI